jgi:hypothetical protein
MLASEEGHVAILNIRDDLSRFGVFIPVKKMRAAQTAFHLLYDVIPSQNLLKAKPRFHGPFIIVKKLDKGAVIVRLQDCSEEIVNSDRCHTFKGQPMIEWTKDFVQSEKKDMGKSTA